MLRLTLLEPDIVEAVLDDRQPTELGAPQLMEPLPANWLFRRKRGSGSKEHTSPEQVELGATESLPLQQLEFVHLSFGLPAAPRHGERSLHRGGVLLQAG